jgi:hypothetical protein
VEEDSFLKPLYSYADRKIENNGKASRQALVALPLRDW